MIPTTIRPMMPADVGPAAAAILDGGWGDLLRAFATPDSAKCLLRDGDVAGFVVRAPWGGGATVAPDPDDAMRLLEARRRSEGSGETVRAGVVDLNSDGIERLRRAGWTEAWRAVRMIRGEPLVWQPGRIWGQFNHALG